MKNKTTALERITKGFKDWTASIQQRFFLHDEIHSDVKTSVFDDPYKNMDAMRDHEMERLVKMIERTRDDNSMRYL